MSAENTTTSQTIIWPAPNFTVESFGAPCPVEMAARRAVRKFADALELLAQPTSEEGK